MEEEKQTKKGLQEVENLLEVQKSRDFTVKLIKIAVFFVIAALAVVGTFLFENNRSLESSVKGSVVASSEASLIFNENEDNILPNKAILRAIASNESQIPFKVRNGNINGAEIFQLDSGRIWGNFLVSSDKVNIVIGRVVLIPEHAVFDLSFDGKMINLTVYNGDMYLGFLDEGVEVNEYLDKYSGLFINNLLVPRDSQVKIPLSKIDERLTKLLYTKLIKEFAYSAIAEESYASEVVKASLRKDQEILESLKQSFVSESIRKGVSTDESVLADFIFWAEENLTFFPDKKGEMVSRNLFDYLDDSFYFAVNKQKNDSLQRFSDFEAYINVFIGQGLDQKILEEKFEGYVSKLLIFGPEDSEYFLTKKFLERQFFQEAKAYESIGNFWLGVYRGLDSSDADSEKALDTYYEYLRIILNEGGEDQLANLHAFLTYQNQLFDNLFLRYPVFYKDGYFAIKQLLEERLLSFYPEGNMKDEIKQAFVSRKIDFLKRLRKFFFEEKIKVNESKAIIGRLISEVDDLMPSSGNELAVTELFESQLNDIANFWGYLNSPEYHTSKTYGLDHQEKFKTYMVEKNKIWDFIDIQNQLLGVETVTADLEESKKELLNYFQQNPDLISIRFLDFEDVKQRYVNVNGVIGGYGFEAKFDRDAQNLSDVYVYDQLIASRPIKLAGLLNILKEKFAGSEGEGDEQLFTEDGEVNEESLAQRRGRIFVAEKLVSLGFVAKMENVEISDPENTTYSVKGVYLTEFSESIVSFDYTLSDEMAKNIYILKGDEPLVLDTYYNLEDLKNLIVAENDFELEELPNSGKVSR